MSAITVIYEFDIAISHPSKTIPWKASGSGTATLVINQIKGMLLNATQLPANPTQFEELCQDITNAADSFEVTTYADMKYDRTVSDYRICFTLTKIKENE